ncbi:LCP family protein [Spirillospora sp. CA-253888]
MNSNPMYMEYVDDADPQDAPAHRRGWRILGWVSIGLSVLMVATSLTFYGAYRSAIGNIKRDDLSSIGPRPKKLNSAMNILLLGSDTREGSNAKYGRQMKNDPPRSDTMILLHLSPGGGQAMGISFPRDLMIPMPSCKKPDGTRSPVQSRAQINSAYMIGGAACVIATIEKMSDIKIDHFMEVNFQGFKAITSAVGGVPICLPNDVADKKSGLFMKKGRHNISGEDALAYVRARHGLGDGSDTDRIKRQQKFMGALANKAMSGGVLKDPNKMMKLISAGTKSLRTDKGLSVPAMLKIAEGMQGMTSGKLRFVTVPSGPDPADRNRVALRNPEAERFFTMIRNDRTVPAESKPGNTPTIPPSQVKVRVFNASGIDGQAGRIQEDLQQQGFQVEIGGNLRSTATTRVLYGEGADKQALTLNRLISGAPQPAPNTTSRAQAGTVDLVVGRSWPGLKSSRAGIPKLTDEVRANDDPCKGA